MLKKVKVTQDFKDECQWKWQCDEKEDALHVKINDKEYKEYKEDKSNKRPKVHVCKGKKEMLSAQCYGVIGIFTKGVLRTISNNKDFVRSGPTDVEGTRLSEEVIQAIKDDEATSVTDALVKDKNMRGV